MAIRVSVNENDFIEVVVEDFAEFVQSWAPFLSATGIFVPTHQILLTGERCSIDVQLLDGFPLIQARGEIVWTRDSSAAALGPSGAAIRLEEVDAAGRDLIERIEDRYVLSGGQRFDVDSPQRKQGEAVLIPEPDAELLKEATLGTLRESTSERRDGVMSISAGQQSPKFAPGMGYADEMRGGTMAPIQSGVWRALRVDDLPGGSKPRSEQGLGAPDRPQAALDALEALDRVGEGATTEPEAPPPGLAPSAGALHGASGTGSPASGASDEEPWGGGLLADGDWDFYEEERARESSSTASGSRGEPTTEPPAAAAADEEAAAGPASDASAAKAAKPREAEPIAPAAAVRPTAPEARRAEDTAVRPATPARAHVAEPAAPSSGAERDPSDAPATPTATPTPDAGRDPGSSSPTRPGETGPSPQAAATGPSSPPETPARPSASTSPAEVRPLHDVAAMRDATPEHDSDSPLWSEPLEAPAAAPRKHAFFEVDDLFRIDDEDDLETELRESAMRVSRTISALSLPDAAKGGEAAGDAASGSRPAPGPKAPEPVPDDESSTAGAVGQEDGGEEEDDDDVVVFERDLERALAELNAPAPDPEPEEDDHDADAVVFERDLERAMSELTGSHPRVELPAEETVPASASVSASEASEPERRSSRSVEGSAAELFAPPQVEAPESEDPEVQAAPPLVERGTPEVPGPVEREASEESPAPAPVSLEREAAPPLPFERPAAPAGRQAAQGQPTQREPTQRKPAPFDRRPASAQPEPSGPRPATPTTRPAAAPGPTPFERPPTQVRTPAGLGGARPQEESDSDGAESGLGSIDEALAEPTGPRRHQPRPIRRERPRSSSEPMTADPAFENVSSEFLRASLAGRAEPERESAAEGAASAAPEAKRDPMRELAESVGGQSWAPWASEPKARRFQWPSLAEMSGPLRIAGLLILAPLFVVLYLGVQQCYGEPVRDASEVPTLGPPVRMTLADSRMILETPGKSLWDLVQEGGLPEVDLLVTTPVGQAARRLVSFGAEAVEGGTIVTLEGDGTFGPVSTVHLRLDGPPREVLKISGVVDPPGGSELAVSTAEVERLRFGYHLRRQYNELQVVADLTSPDVRLVEITVERRSLVLRFESRPAG